MPTDTTTQAFLTTEGQAEEFEYELGSLAQNQSGNAAVAGLAAWFSNDGRFLQQDLGVVAKDSGGVLDEIPTAAQEALVTALKPLSGAAFDRSYLATDLAAQMTNLAAKQAYIATGTQALVVQAARAEVPLLEDHIHTLQLIDAAYNGSAGPTVAFSTAYAATPPLAATAPLNAQDRQFVSNATNYALTLKAEGQLAMSRANVSSMAVLGAWSLASGGQLAADVASLAASAGATVPGGVDAASAAQIATLGGLTGRAFDVQFASYMILNDQAALPMDDAEYNAGADPALRARADSFSTAYTTDALLGQAVIEYGAIKAGLTDASAAPSTFAGAVLRDAGRSVSLYVPIAGADGTTTTPGAIGNAIYGIQFVNGSGAVAPGYTFVLDTAAAPVTIDGTAAYGTRNPGYDLNVEVSGSTAGMTYYGAAGGYVDIALTGGTNMVLSALSTADNGDYTVGVQGGSNTIYAGNSDDTIITTGGRSLIGLGSGRNVVISGANDTVVGSTGNDTVFATGGADVVFGGAKGITYVAGASPVFGSIYTGSAAITVYSGNDSSLQIIGAAPGSVIVAGAGNETLTGVGLSKGAVYFAGSGNDQIDGSSNSTYVAGSGNATIAGGAGADLFQFFDGHAGGTDQIAFKRSDVISLVGYASDAAAQVLAAQADAGTTVRFTLADNTQVTLTGIASLSASNFV